MNGDKKEQWTTWKYLPGIICSSAFVIKLFAFIFCLSRNAKASGSYLQSETFVVANNRSSIQIDINWKN